MQNNTELKEFLKRSRVKEEKKKEEICVLAELKVLKDGKDIYPIISVISMQLLPKEKKNTVKSLLNVTWQTDGILLTIQQKFMNGRLSGIYIGGDTKKIYGHFLFKANISRADQIAQF